VGLVEDAAGDREQLLKRQALEVVLGVAEHERERSVTVLDRPGIVERYDSGREPVEDLTR